MLDLIYISHLQQGKQKNLAYALKLAKAFSSPLSLLPTSKLNDPQRGKMLIWRPNRDNVKNDKIPASENKMKYSKREKRLPIFLLAKSDQQGQTGTQEYKIVKQVIDSGFPLFILPYNYSFNGIRNVLFTGNASGFTDHTLKHQIAATFRPRAFKLGNSGLKEIHWNNICHISESSWPASKFSSRDLNISIRRHYIDLTIFPIVNNLYPIDSYSFRELRELLLFKTPTLLIPLLTKELILGEETERRRYPFLIEGNREQIGISTFFDS